MKSSYYSLGFFKDYGKLAEIENVCEFRELIFKPLMYSWKTEVETDEDEVKACLARDYMPEAYELLSYPHSAAMADFKNLVTGCLKVKRRHNAEELQNRLTCVIREISETEKELKTFHGIGVIFCRFGRFCRLKKKLHRLLKEGASADDWLNWGFYRFGVEALSLNY